MPLCVRLNVMLIDSQPHGLAHAGLVAVAVSAGAAVRYCHARGFIRCDIKPENLLLKRFDELQRGGFGTAVYRRDWSATHGDDSALPWAW